MPRRLAAFGIHTLLLVVIAAAGIGVGDRPPWHLVVGGEVAHAARPARRSQRIEVERLLASMTLEEKVGQLLMVGFAGTGITPEIEMWIKRRKVGGVALFSRNIVDFAQTARFTRELHGLAAGGVPLFVALDQEGGNVMRVKDGAMPLPGNMALGAARDTTLAYVAGQALAIDLRLLGFNMNLAPVLDVNSNPNNPVIGVRSYGERPELVGNLGAWYVRGQQEMGVVAVAKHFPGHGETHSDSHFSMPSIDVDYARLQEVELHPFARAMDAGLDAVMTAHIALPRIAEERNMPATLSHRILTGVLRKALGFDGIVLTDGLEMQGIVERFGSGRASVLAIQAGADMPMILWTPKIKEEVYATLLQAARSGEISKDRLHASVRRILRTKVRRGLFQHQLEPLEQVLQRRNDNPVHAQVAQRIARAAVTLVRNRGEVLPLRAKRYRNVVAMAPPGQLAEQLAREPHIEVVSVPFVPGRERRWEIVHDMIARGRGADAIMITLVNRYHLEMARRILKALPHVPSVVVSMASPYYLSSVPAVDAYVCAYSHLESSQEAVADGVLGRMPMTGRLPVSIPGYYAFGHRVEDRLAAMPAGEELTRRDLGNGGSAAAASAAAASAAAAPAAAAVR